MVTRVTAWSTRGRRPPRRGPAPRGAAPGEGARLAGGRAAGDALRSAGEGALVDLGRHDVERQAEAGQQVAPPGRGGREDQHERPTSLHLWVCRFTPETWGGPGWPRTRCGRCGGTYRLG